MAGVAEAQAEPSEALKTATPPAASSSSSSNRAADDDAVGTVVVTDPDDDGKASVDDGTLLSPETDDGDDDGGDDDDDACAAITDEGECHASSACQWKSDDSTCFASQLDDDDRAAQPDQPTVATADDGASGDDGAGDDGASGLVSGLSLSVSNEYERTLGYSIGDGLYPFENLVEMYKPTRLTVSDTAGDPQQNENYTWIVRGTDDARHAPTKLTARGDVVEARFVQLGSNLVLVTASTTNASFTFDVTAKYVRRELRELTAADRERYFDALATVYRTSQEDGERAFGPMFRSAAWLVREHLYGAAQRECDHWHDDAGFLTHHVGITLQLEQSLRAVDQRVCSHYWDYTVDALANATYAQSVIFDEEWFGSAQPTDDRHVVSTGRWAYTPVLSDARAFSNVTNPYGLLRSPWNTNPTPYLTRAGTVIGVETADYVLPSCTDFRSYVNKSGTPNGLIRIADVVSALNGALHGPVHIMIGGHWGFNESVVAKVEALHSIGGDAFTDQILLGAKFLWRQGYIECPETCEYSSRAGGVHVDGGDGRVSRDEASCACGLNPQVWDASLDLAARDLAAETILSDAGIDAIAPMLATTYVGGESIGLSYSAFLELLSHVGHPGEMFTSAAPQDPTFWPLHGLAERLVQLLRLMAMWGDIELDETWGYNHVSVLSDTRVVCDWSDLTGGKKTDDALNARAGLPACVRNTTCPGHHAHDVLPFENVLIDSPGSKSFYTNAEFYAAISPSNRDLPYVYDKLTTWPGCESGKLFKWIDARSER